MKLNTDNFFKTCTPYSITINPCDKFQYHNRPDRIKRVNGLIYEALLSYDTFNVLEFSEPRGMSVKGKTGPRLHTHGILYFKKLKDLKRFMAHGYYNILRFASLDIDTIDDLEKWFAYMNKQNILSVKERYITRYISYKMFLKDITS